MQTNHSFSMQRFFLLCKQSLIINKKLIIIALVGFVGTLFIALMLFQSASANDFKGWNLDDYIVLFFFLFFGLGIICTSLSFPAFRSKEKSMAFLMLPSSSSEKYVFEILTRLVVFILLMPLLYWAVANIEGAIMHYYYPEFEHYKFSFEEAYYKITNSDRNNYRLIFMVVQGGLFAFIFSFAGASYFSKSPLLKTLFTFSVIVAGYALLSILLFKSLNISEYQSGRNVFHMDKDDALIFGAIGLTVINLSLLAVSWFNLKEKEA